MGQSGNPGERRRLRSFDCRLDSYRICRRTGTLTTCRWSRCLAPNTKPADTHYHQQHHYRFSAHRSLESDKKLKAAEQRIRQMEEKLKRKHGWALGVGLPLGRVPGGG